MYKSYIKYNYISVDTLKLDMIYTLSLEYTYIHIYLERRKYHNLYTLPPGL